MFGRFLFHFQPFFQFLLLLTPFFLLFFFLFSSLGSDPVGHDKLTLLVSYFFVPLPFSHGSYRSARNRKCAVLKIAITPPPYSPNAWVKLADFLARNPSWEYRVSQKKWAVAFFYYFPSETAMTTIVTPLERGRAGKSYDFFQHNF